MLKVLQWTVCPTHHQSYFQQALREAGIDLQVRYHERVNDSRIAMGWDAGDKLRPDEQYVEKSVCALETVEDWRDRIHIVSGYRERFMRNIIMKLSAENVDWVHWSESTRPGIRWWLSYPYKRWYARIVNRHALGVFAIGLSAIKDFEHWGIKPEKIAFLPYAVQAADRCATPEKECETFCEGRKAFLYLGSLRHRKGTDLLLKAFAKATHQNKEWVLLLVGDDRSDGAYEGLARKLNIEKRTLFRGPIPAGDISGVLKTAQVLLLPSRNEGWGLTFNEAASMGLALIGTEQVGSAWHVIEQGKNGFRVKADNVDALANAMRRYIDNPSLADEHGPRSLEIFKKFTPEHNAQRFIEGIRDFRAMEQKACV